MNLRSFDSRLGLLIWLVLFARVLPASAQQATDQPVDIGTRVEMFVDDWLIDPAHRRNISLELQTPERREVVFTTDKPWEGYHSAYYTIFKDGSKYRLYYRGSAAKVDKSEQQFTCYAESDDGIHFVRPNLGLYEFNGSKENNILFSGTDSHNFAPFLDANPAANPGKRYKALAGIASKLYALGSADGLHWKKLQTEAVMTKGTFDSLNLAFWDTQAKCYRAFSRYFDRGAYKGYRAIQNCESKDFLHWAEPQPNHYADGVPKEHFYTNATFPCPGAPHHYLAFPMRFMPERKKIDEMKEPGVSDAMFMSSRDGQNWDRSHLESWLRPGTDQRNWTHRSNMPAWGIVQTSPDEFSMYVSEHYGWPDNRLRRVTVRRHGFSSAHATPAGGEFTTRPLVFGGEKLALNYATSAAGSIAVEIQDESGKPLPGYALADMKPLYGDELDAAISWKSKRDVSGIAGKLVRLHFVMHDADIFSLRTAKSDEKLQASANSAQSNDNMKTTAIKKLKQKLASNDTVFGMWVTLESASITEMAVSLGLDWIVIDAEHGQLDWQEVVGHIRATVRSDTIALVRLTEHNISLVKRALDMGADGVVIPWVETADQLRELVKFAHYPPAGLRGIGAERATAWGQCIPQHIAEAGEDILVIPMIESVRGGQNIGEMVKVEGVDMFLLGPADYSSSAGFAGQWQGPGIGEQLLQIRNTIAAAGKCCGVISTSEANLIERREQGFRMIGLGSDCGFLIRGIHTMLATAGRDRKMDASLTPRAELAESAPLPKPPESFRPDRMEVMNDFGTGKKIEIQPGVVFEALVGAHNGAKKLTTGVVRFSPGVKLAYHIHPTTESIVLLEGSAVVDVEGRRYRLSPLDNVVIPSGVPHGVENLLTDRETLLHVTFPTGTPARELLEPIYPPRQMPDDSVGPRTPGLERVNRFSSAERFDTGQGATFIDFFNDTSMPGIEMSGGYGLFQPGGRLPAHIHDFDESICIVGGTATCIVEGRRYSMSGYSTALEPRGRVHYFVNETNEPMAMVWVYAGPQPQRIVVDERNATTEGNPWQ